MNIKKRFHKTMEWVNENPVYLFLSFCLIFLCIAALLMSYNSAIMKQNSVIISKMDDMAGVNENLQVNCKALGEGMEDFQKQIDALNAQHNEDIKAVMEKYDNLSKALTIVNSTVETDRERIFALYEKAGMKVDGAYNEEKRARMAKKVEATKPPAPETPPVEPSAPKTEAVPPPVDAPDITGVKVPPKPRGAKRLLPWNWFK